LSFPVSLELSCPLFVRHKASWSPCLRSPRCTKICFFFKKKTSHFDR
jgi:hypothetical protein